MDSCAEHKPKITIEDLQRVAPLVLEKLRGMAKLPDYGTVAGQAVASLMWEALDLPMRGPVNDIDVFVNRGLPRTMRGREEREPDLPADRDEENKYKRGNPTSSNAKVFFHNHDPYHHVAEIAIRCNTKILSTYRVGIVNYTLVWGALIHPGSFGHDIAVSRSLVDGFDLNIVGVGINLETGQVAATDDFIEFLQTGKIQAQTCNTPAHTLIRLADKVYGGQIKGVTCDYKKERLLLECAIACQQEKKNDYFNAPIVNFGIRYLERYQKLADYLPNVIHIEGKEDDYPLHTFAVNNEAVLASGPLFDLVHQGGGNSITRRLAGVEYFPTLWRNIQDEMNHGINGKTHQAVALMGENDGLFHLSKAIGSFIPEVSIPGMDEQMRTVFFFGQTCVLNKELTQEAIETWTKMSPLKRALMVEFLVQADEILALGRSDDYMKTILANHGTGMMISLSQYSSQDGKYNEHLDILDSWINHLEQMGDKGQKIMTNIVRTETPKEKETEMGFLKTVKLLNEIPGRAQTTGEKLLTLCFPKWQELLVENGNCQSKSLHYCAAMGSEIPEKYLEKLGDHEVNENILVLAKIGIEKTQDTGQINRAMEFLLPKLSTYGLMKDHYMAARAAIEGKYVEALINELIRRSREMGNTRHFERIIHTFEKIKSTGTVPGLDGKEVEYSWGLGKTEDETKRIEKAVDGMRLAQIMIDTEILKDQQRYNDQIKAKAPKM